MDAPGVQQAVRLRLAVGVCNIPHPEKASYGGEDAYFYSSATASLGVADGVGGWHDEGINPGGWPQALAAGCCTAGACSGPMLRAYGPRWIELCGPLSEHCFCLSRCS